MLKTALTWLTTLGLAFGLALASAAAFSAWNPEPKPKHYDDIKQSATATAKGIRLEVLGASFSGTETLVRMKASVADPEALRGEVGTDSVSLVVPAPQGFSGPFNEGESATRRIPSGELLVTLPSILSEAGYDGTVDLKFDELMVTVPSGPTRLSGQWSLRLTGPAPGDLSSVLRMEEFLERRIEVQGHEIIANGRRSTSATYVEIVLPPGVLMVAQPLLHSEGERLAPQSFAPLEGKVEVSFPPTQFETEVALELGSLALSTGEQPEPVIVDIGSAIRRSGTADGEFDIDPLDIVGGPAQLVLGGDSGRYNARPWVGLELAGNWHPEGGKAIVFDQKGNELTVAHVQVGYRKDLDGSVREGSTNIAVFVDDVQTVGRLTFILGVPSRLAEPQPQVVLRPR
jgi:hypothetical protein